MKLLERVLLCLPLLSLLVAPLLWSAPEARGAGAVTQRVDLTSASDRAAWVGRIRSAQQAVDEARVRQDQAAIDYSRARAKRKARGEAKREVIQERQQSSGELEDAERHLDETLGAARSAGVPPGWIREGLGGSDPANRN